MDDFIKCDVVAIGDGLFTHTGDRIPMSTTVNQEIFDSRIEYW